MTKEACAELLGKGDYKSSQPKRKQEDGEIEDSPIDNDYPLKVPRTATKEEVRDKAREQREKTLNKACELVRNEDFIYYADAVIDVYLARGDTEEYNKECVTCHSIWTTWNSSFTLCNECEEAFLALVTDE